MPFLIPFLQIFRPREPPPSWPGPLPPLPRRRWTHKVQAVKWLHMIHSIQHEHTCKHHGWCERRDPSWVWLIFGVKGACFSQAGVHDQHSSSLWCQPDRFCWATCQCNSSKIQTGYSLPLGSGQTLNRQLQLYFLVATAFTPCGPLYHPQSNLETVEPGRAANEYSLS